MQVRLVKEPDNKYHTEAIKDEKEAFGKIGHIASSAQFSESSWAGRICDSIYLLQALQILVPIISTTFAFPIASAIRHFGCILHAARFPIGSRYRKESIGGMP